MATCIYCNAQIADNIRYCTECGAALPVEAAIETMTAPLEQAIANSSVQQPYQQPSYEQPFEQPDQQANNQYWQQPAQQPGQAGGYQQPGYQQPYTNAQPLPQPYSDDSGSIGWGVLGFFIPLVGLILFLVWRTSKPNCARVAGIGALIGFCLSMVLRFGFLSSLL